MDFLFLFFIVSIHPSFLGRRHSQHHVFLRETEIPFNTHSLVFYCSPDRTDGWSLFFGGKSGMDGQEAGVARRLHTHTRLTGGRGVNLFFTLSPFIASEPHLSLEDGPIFSVGQSVVRIREMEMEDTGLWQDLNMVVLV